MTLPAGLVSGLVFPLHERLLGRDTFTYRDELERSQWLPREQVEALQARKLTELLSLVQQHCPWHASRLEEAELNPAKGWIGHNELLRLPTMTKAEARAHGASMVWREVPGGAHRYNTGGSSGEPLIFNIGRRRQASDAAGRMRARRWWGVNVGEPEVYLWGAPVELAKTDKIKVLRDRLINQMVLNAFDMSPAHMDDYIDAIRRFRPKCLYGYASSIALLAAHARARGATLQLPSLKVVCATGEPLYPDQRQFIEEVFGVPVANEFGSRDIGFTAHESPEGQMLLMSESIILEVLDAEGSPVEPGEVGEAVMTGLRSEAQPFIRYRTGDMVRVADETCVAGRGLHVVGEIMGRQTDFVVRADGTVLHALAVIYVLRDLEGIGEFKVIQHDTRQVEVLVVLDEACDRDVTSRIVAGLQQRLGDDVHVEVRPVDSIPPEASGKFRYVVSHVPLPGDLEPFGLDHSSQRRAASE